RRDRGKTPGRLVRERGTAFCLWRIKSEYVMVRGMAVRSCRVTIQDLEGVAHTVDVTAESLYEAVAQGLAALRRNDWVAGFQQGVIKVSVADVRVEHQVKMTDFTQWLE